MKGLVSDFFIILTISSTAVAFTGEGTGFVLVELRSASWCGSIVSMSGRGVTRLVILLRFDKPKAAKEEELPMKRNARSS